MGRQSGAALLLVASVATVTVAAAAEPDLAALPTTGWLTNGGNLANQRYSPLTQINTDNVAGMKAVWRAALKSGLSPRSGNQAQPIVLDGVIYIMTGENDAFAVSVDTGAILWEYRAHIDAKLARPCCSWAGRGVGLGDGKVYVGQLDAKLVALDQKTGAVAWSGQAEDPARGYVIASAPLTNVLTHDAIVTVVTGGRNQMPAFGSALQPQEREDLAAYVLQLVK